MESLDPACDEALRELIRNRLDAFERVREPLGPQRRSSVAVAVAEEGTGADLAGVRVPRPWSPAAALLLTRRAASLKTHSGQWALPGGRIEPGESPEDAALREMREEIGLALPREAVLGTLDDYVTRSGFVITPVVVWAGTARDLAPDPSEVSSVHRIPLCEFLREDAPILEPSEDPGRQILRMPVGERWIAAPTAAVLYQFREVALLDRATRVGHFDQPLFARR